MRILLIYLAPLDNEPMGLMCIGTSLKEAGYLVKIIGIEKHESERKLLKEISDFKPDIVGISIITSLSDKAQHIANFIKNNFSKITIIAGGPHPTILPYETLKNGNIDIGVIGEGELTAVDLVETLSSSRPLEKVRGIAFIKNGNLVLTEKREYIENLDDLPFADRELMPKDVIYGRAGYPVANPVAFLMTVRGCPYQCSFCQPTLGNLFGKKVRRRSPESVIAEIIELKKKYGINGLWINDDTFMFNRDWVEKFCDLMIEKKLNMLWYSNGRINCVDKDILIKMRDAGCVGLVLTPESGSARIRNEILNKNLSDEEILKAYRICHEVGIPMQANIMLASPTETEKDMDLSITLIKKLQPHFMSYSYTTALPGTYLYSKYAKEISASPYYSHSENYDIGKFKKMGTNIPDSKLRAAQNLFNAYSSNSFSNRARHFFQYPYFRKILYKRWKTLIFNRHPNFKHLIFDFAAIILGSVIYFKNREIYKTV